MSDEKERVRVSYDLVHVLLEVGPDSLDVEGMFRCIEAFTKWRQRLLPVLSQQTYPEEATGFSLHPKEALLRSETLVHVVELAAPSLLLLLGGGSVKPIRIEVDQDFFRVSVPHALPEGVSTRVIPVVVGSFMALIRDAQRAALPPSLIRHPRLVTATQAGKIVEVAQYLPDGQRVLHRGRLTRLPGETLQGDAVRIYAQQSLTVLFLYAEVDVRRLVHPNQMDVIKQTVLGESALPIDERPSVLPYEHSDP